MTHHFIDTIGLVPKCSLCGKEVKYVRPQDHAKIPLEEDAIEGAANWFTHGYGSKFDGENWLLCFCNDCLNKMKPLKIFDYLDFLEVEDT